MESEVQGLRALEPSTIQRCAGHFRPCLHWLLKAPRHHLRLPEPHCRSHSLPGCSRDPGTAAQAGLHAGACSLSQPGPSEQGQGLAFPLLPLSSSYRKRRTTGRTPPWSRPLHACSAQAEEATFCGLRRLKSQPPSTPQAAAGKEKLPDTPRQHTSDTQQLPNTTSHS